MRGEHEPDRDRLAVQQRVTGRRLERVRDGVAVVEHGPHTGTLVLVGGRPRRLDLGAAGDDVGERRGIARDERVDVRRHEVVAHQRVLGDLAQPAAVLAVGQRLQHARIREHATRLMERADEVLALGQVHTGLAADRAVDHREQRGGHLHDVDPAVVDRGREAGGVADDSPADRDDSALRSSPNCGEATAQLLDGCQRLRVLAFADREAFVLDAGSRDARRRPRAHVPADLRLRDERDLAPPA